MIYEAPGFYAIYTKGEGDRLTPREAQRIADHAYRVHNHLASAPQPAIFWVRIEEDFRA